MSLPRFETKNAVVLRDLSFWGATLLMISLGLVLTYRVVSRIIGPLETLTVAARQIAAGERPREAPIRSRNEIGTLAQAFDSMNRQLASRIADLQQQGRRLEHNNEQLETVLGAMVEGVIAVDDCEQVILANNAVFRLLDMTPTAMVGRPLWEAVRHPRIEELVRRALRGEACERLEFQVSRAQTTISVAVSQLPGVPCPGAVLVLHDVTELRRLERLRREFVANVSHELKTPLTSIAAYTETLLDGAMDDPEHNREFLQRIEEQTERLQLLIADLLALANMEAEEPVLELAPVDAARVIAASVDAHQAVAESKRIQLVVSGAQDEVEVLAEEEGVRVILDNLLDNAINYTPTGGRVTVRCSTAGEWFQIDITDTGVGIAREHQARIFERFFRVDRARSREIGGTGLGLSIVKHWCQMFGGSVSVVSQVGQGSTFTVRLKRALTDVLT
jgi:two-component system phosphate regulon sensor histidine kinase PhoR